MEFKILQPGAFALLQVKLNDGEMVKAESDAMVSMTSNITINSKMEGGLLGGLARSFLSGESMFFQTLTAKGGAGQVVLAPAVPGDIQDYHLDGNTTLFIQSGGFLAAENSINVDTKMQNLGKGMFSGAGLFVVKVSGTGTVFFNTFGAIYTVELQPGETYIVDTGHIVAWESSMNYQVQKASSGWVNSITSGECLVCKFTGPGKIYMQSRNPSAFGSWVNGFIPAK